MTSTGSTSVYCCSPAICTNCDGYATCRSPSTCSTRCYAGRYLVQVAAPTCIDLANHVTASGSHRVLVKDDLQRVWAYHDGVDLGGPAMARVAKDYGYTLAELRKL